MNFTKLIDYIKTFEKDYDIVYYWLEGTTLMLKVKLEVKEKEEK